MNNAAEAYRRISASAQYRHTSTSSDSDSSSENGCSNMEDHSYQTINNRYPPGAFENATSTSNNYELEDVRDWFRQMKVNFNRQWSNSLAKKVCKLSPANKSNIMTCKSHFRDCKNHYLPKGLTAFIAFIAGMPINKEVLFHFKVSLNISKNKWKNPRKNP